MSYDGGYDGGGEGGGGKKRFELDPSYNDVASRIRELRAAFPDGRLRPADPAKPYTIENVGGQTYIVYVAACYRDQWDQLPGIGMAWEPVPGKTQFTKASELQNAETSAWGRAIVAALIADTKTVASAEEVRNRAAEEGIPDTPRGRRGNGSDEPAEVATAGPELWATILGYRMVLSDEGRDLIRTFAAERSIDLAQGAAIPLGPARRMEAYAKSLVPKYPREADPNADPPHPDAEEPQDGPQPSIEELRHQMAAVQRDGTVVAVDGPVMAPSPGDTFVAPDSLTITEGPVETWECDGPDRHAIKGPRGSKCPMQGCGGFLGPEEPF